MSDIETLDRRFCVLIFGLSVSPVWYRNDAFQYNVPVLFSTEMGGSGDLLVAFTKDGERRGGSGDLLATFPTNEGARSGGSAGEDDPDLKLESSSSLVILLTASPFFNPFSLGVAVPVDSFNGDVHSSDEGDGGGDGEAEEESGETIAGIFLQRPLLDYRLRKSKLDSLFHACRRMFDDYK
jgi:hypothetical protein